MIQKYVFIKQMAVFLSFYLKISLILTISAIHNSQSESSTEDQIRQIKFRGTI